jgi:hypothetical protein
MRRRRARTRRHAGDAARRFFRSHFLLHFLILLFLLLT